MDDDNQIVKSSYIFVRKPKEEMQKEFKSQAKVDILKPDDTCYILKSLEHLEEIKISQIRDYQFASPAEK